MDVCVLNQEGEILLHRDMKAAPEPFLKAMASYRADVVVGVEGIFTWYGLADLCAHASLPCVLGHALSMKALHGGTATNDRIDAHKIAVLWRGGRLPQASVYPAAMRATRDRLRRRMHLTRTRAELRAPIQKTNSQYNLPEIGTKRADTAHRDGVAERVPESAVQKRIDLDLPLIDAYDRVLTDLELELVRMAQEQDAQTFSRLRSIPGGGTILALVLLYEIHDLHRFPRVQAFVSSCRLVTGAKESAGKRLGTSGTKIGHASLTGAFSDAAVLFWRNHPAGPQSRARLVKKHGQGKAFTVLAHKLARAGGDMLKRATAFDRDKFFHEYRSGAREPAASRAAEGIRLAIECWCR
jgi:transposase